MSQSADLKCPRAAFDHSGTLLPRVLPSASGAGEVMTVRTWGPQGQGVRGLK
jgi:hypothetical protein